MSIWQAKTVLVHEQTSWLQIKQCALYNDNTTRNSQVAHRRAPPMTGQGARIPKETKADEKIVTNKQEHTVV